MDLSEFSAWWPGLLFSFGCFVVTFVIRKIAEGSVSSLKTNHYWNEALLPTLPILLGGVAGLLMTQFPYPVQNPAWSFRLLLGIVAGFASAWAVKIVKAIVKSKTGVDLDAVSVVATETSTTVTETKESSVAVTVPVTKDPPPLPPAS